MATPLRHYGTEKPYSHPEPVTKRQFVKDVLQDFLIDPKFRNMNHGTPLMVLSTPQKHGRAGLMRVKQRY